MKIYFVRHGECTQNVSGIYEGENSPLTPKGKEQARFVAERFTRIPVYTILSSDMLRARETAEAVHETVGKVIEYSSLLREADAPAELIGKGSVDPELQKWIRDRISDEHYKYSNEESFFELKKRAEKALSFITKHKDGEVCVVTHGTFLRIMLGVMMEGSVFSIELFSNWKKFLCMSNTGITVCQKSDGSKTSDGFEVDRSDAPYKGWRLITWNDHAHLG